ncbi:MAG: hypothetical protein K0V04_20480 [Deltaproteobacteria bacterium]|nr:hypothetical protein [Deltaproteobacteria bacterium]
MDYRGWSKLLLMAVVVPACVTEVGVEPRQVSLNEAEEELSAALCDTMFDCDCTERSYEDVFECYQEVEDVVIDTRNATSGAALVYDPVCMARYVDALLERGCAAPLGADTDTDADACERWCPVLHGRHGIGERCQPRSGWTSDCDKGLVCDRVCFDPCDPDPDLFGQAGQECRVDRPCATGLSCDMASNLCQPPPDLGELCPRGQCVEGAFCDSDVTIPGSAPVCQVLARVGEPCRGHAQCVEGWCPNGFCGTPPGLGESCADTSSCDQGLACISEVCETAAPSVCASVVGV